MIKLNRIEYDDTPSEPQVVGICWYTPASYGPCLEVFDDRDELHKTYEDWLESALAAEAGLTQRGARVIRVQMEPASFLAWCRENEMASIDRKARTIYSGMIALESISDD